jgi:hypothetical protein
MRNVLCRLISMQEIDLAWSPFFAGRGGTLVLTFWEWGMYGKADPQFPGDPCGGV